VCGAPPWSAVIPNSSDKSEQSAVRLDEHRAQRPAAGPRGVEQGTSEEHMHKTGAVEDA
jgi:hypothetical protein